MSTHHLISTAIIVVIAIGLWKRKDMKVHVPAMIMAFVADVALVLSIELNRQAIEKVVEDVQSPQNHELLLFHVAVSLATIILYAVLTVLGFKILKGQRALVKLHRNLAAVFILCRLTNYVTSFMIMP